MIKVCLFVCLFLFLLSLILSLAPPSKGIPLKRATKVGDVKLKKESIALYDDDEDEESVEKEEEKEEEEEIPFDIKAYDADSHVAGNCFFLSFSFYFYFFQDQSTWDQARALLSESRRRLMFVQSVMGPPSDRLERLRENRKKNRAKVN